MIDWQSNGKAEKFSCCLAVRRATMIINPRVVSFLSPSRLRRFTGRLSSEFIRAIDLTFRPQVNDRVQQIVFQPVVGRLG